MINLKKIVLNNFGAYLGKHELVFPENGLYSIVGKYENEPERSNGAGKTFLVRAIAYCFDFAELPSASLQNYNTEEPFSVDLTLELDGKCLEIHRDKNNYIIGYDGKEFKSVAAREFLKTFVLDSPLISFVTYRQQDERGNFLPLKPAEKVEFLSNLLKLEKYQNIIDSSNEKLKIVELALNKLSSEEDIVRVELFSNKEKIELLNDSILLIKQQVNNKQTELANKKEPCREDFVDENKFQDLTQRKNVISSMELTSDKGQKLEALEAGISEQFKALGLSIDTYEDAKIKLIDAIEKNKELKASLSIIEDKQRWNLKKLNTTELQEISCPECWAVFSPNANHKHELKILKEEKGALVEEYNEIEKNIQKNQRYIEKYKDIGSLDKSLKQSKILNDEFIREKELFEINKDKQLSKVIYEMQFFHENNQKLFEDAKQRDLIARQSLRIDLEALDKNINDVNVKINSLKDKEIFLNNKNDLIKTQLKSNREERNYLNEVVSCLGKENFIRLITEETLAFITSKVNRFLADIPNTEKITVRLSIDKETKKGTLKKNINLQVFSSGIERPFEEFSGGEKCSINLATDTAISEIIAERTGKRFNWFILDEGQGGMDGVTKMESLQVLNKLAKNKLILVVDHSDHVNEHLDGKIIVLKTKEGSSIVTSNTNGTKH